MANEIEIEHLITRIVADTSDFSKGMNKAADDAEKASTAIVDDLKKIEKTQEDLRKNSALEDFFNPKPPPPPPSDPYSAMRDGGQKMLLQKQREQENAEFAEAVAKKKHQEDLKRQAELDRVIKDRLAQHAAEERRFQKEAESRDRERAQVQRQLDQEAAARMRQRMQEHADSTYSGGGDGPGPLETDNAMEAFGGATESALGYQDALKGIGVLYSAHQFAVLAMASAMEELAIQQERAGHLQSRLLEGMNYRNSEADEKAASLPVKERVEFLQQELKKRQEIAENARKRAEEAAKEEERARGPQMGSMTEGGGSKYLVGQALESAAGHTARTLNIGGADTAHTKAMEAMTEANQVARASAEAVQKYQRQLEDLQPGGDDAEHAMNRFRVAMERQTEMVMGGRKAIILFNLEQQNLSEEQKKEAEAIFEREEKKQEAFKQSQHVTDQYFHDELSRIDELARKREQTTKSVMTPMEQYIEKKQELDELLEDGLSQETYNRAIDQAKEKYDKATKSAEKHHHALKEGRAIMFGGSEATLRAQSQIELLTKPGTPDKIGPKGPRDDDIANALIKIEQNTKKNELGGGATMSEIMAANI